MKTQLFGQCFESTDRAADHNKRRFDFFADVADGAHVPLHCLTLKSLVVLTPCATQLYKKGPMQQMLVNARHYYAFER
jgi:hypothetical protein